MENAQRVCVLHAERFFLCLTRLQNDDKGVNFGIASTVVRLQFIIYMTGSDIFDGITPITHGKIE